MQNKPNRKFTQGKVSRRKTIAEKISGQLTATILAEKEEYPNLGPLIQKLKNRINRIFLAELNMIIREQIIAEN